MRWRVWTYVQAQVILCGILRIRSHPLEYMHSHPVRPCPVYFGLCVHPSLYYVLYAKSKGSEDIEYLCRFDLAFPVHILTYMVNKRFISPNA